MPAARPALLELFTDDLADSGFAFRNGRGGPRLARDIARAFQTVVDKAGLPETEYGRVTFHSLRRTALARLANHPSIPLVYVRDFAGHVSLATFTSWSRRRRRPPPCWRWPASLARSRHVQPGTGRTDRNGREPVPAQQSRSQSERVRKATVAANGA